MGIGVLNGIEFPVDIFLALVLSVLGSLFVLVDGDEIDGLDRDFLLSVFKHLLMLLFH